MGHEITNTDNMFSVREQTWHGLGEVLADYPTRAEAQAIAHPWEPVTEPLFRREVVIDEEAQHIAEEYREVEGSVLNVRSDNGAVLGVVGDGYVPVTNAELWDIAEAVQGDNPDVMFETAGSLAGGRKVWILIRLTEPLLVKGDLNGATIPYFALQNAHDGSGAVRGQSVMTRIVCANTSHAADMEARARGTEFTFRHTLNVKDRIEQARQALAGWRAGLVDWQMSVEELVETKITHEAERAFMDRFMPLPDAEIISERVRTNIELARADFNGIYRGITNESITGTAYGLVQAAVEYAEHYRNARTQETRFKRAYLDRSDIVQHASKLARELATV